MKVKRLYEEIEKKLDIDKIRYIALPSIADITNLPRSVLNYTESWWLQDKCRGDSYHVRGVNKFGSIENQYVYDKAAVRPILICSDLSSQYLNIGDYVTVFDLLWQYIGNNRVLLADYPLTEMEFVQEEDGAPDPNNYDNSDIRVFLYNWLDKQIEEQDKLDEITYLDW